MTVRVVPRLAREASTAPCARCLDVVTVTAGEWHATAPGDLDRVVCDACAKRDDEAGYAQLEAWRRMARPTSRSARA